MTSWSCFCFLQLDDWPTNTTILCSAVPLEPTDLLLLPAVQLEGTVWARWSLWTEGPPLPLENEPQSCKGRLFSKHELKLQTELLKSAWSTDVTCRQFHHLLNLDRRNGEWDVLGWALKLLRLPLVGKRDKWKSLISCCMHSEVTVWCSLLASLFLNVL